MVMLNEMKCTVCFEGDLPMDDLEIMSHHEQVPQWALIQDGMMVKLQRIFSFDNFASALVFTNQLAQLAEDEGHHPAILLEWGKVTVTWWTHKINGLHRNDFVMASKTDQLLSEKQGAGG